MATLGNTGRSSPGQFDGKKKLLLIPTIPITPDFESSNGDLCDKYWDEVVQQIGGLESALATVKFVFHEMIHVGGEEGVKLVEAVSTRASSSIKRYIGSGASMEPVEDEEVLREISDWQRCMSIGLLSKKVYELAMDSYQNLTKQRFETISQKISDTMNTDDVALLFIAEGHGVQFESDVQVFYVSPPSANELRNAIRIHVEKQMAEFEKQSEDEA